MSTYGPRGKKEEHAPSLFGWLRSAAAKTRDEAELNPRIGRANVGVSGPGNRTFRLPSGTVRWIITIAVIALLAAVVVPAVGGFIDGVSDALEEAIDEGSSGSGQSDAGRAESERLQRRARRQIEAQGTGNSFSLANCVTAAQGDQAAIAECNQRLLDQVDVSTTPAAPPPQFDELNRMADCVQRAGADIDRIVECTSR